MDVTITNKPYQPISSVKSISTIVLTTILLTSLPQAVAASEMMGSGYIIKMGTINIVGGSSSGTNTKLDMTVGQTIQGEFEKTGYKIKAGFQYLTDREPFGFSISSDSVNLGTLVANSFGSSTATITVTGSGTDGYSILAIENHPLQVPNSQTDIPDTACDPNEKCTPSNAAPWTSSTAYGFGYNLTGDAVDKTDFLDATYFRPFANNSLNHNPAVILSQRGYSKKSVSTITFRANISPTQLNGTYENSIQFIALPNY